MGDITSTCCNNTTHLMENHTTKHFEPTTPNPKQIKIQSEPFEPASESIRDTFVRASKSKYYDLDAELTVDQNSQIFSKEGVLTVTKKNQGNADGSSFFSLSRNRYQIYIKSLSEHNKFDLKEEEFSGLYFIYFPDKRYFLGQIGPGNKPESGIFVFKPGCYYAGKIRELYAEGEGKYENEDNGYCYEGFWSKNLQHGHGTQAYRNGDVFEGQFMYGSKFGNGTYKFADGKVYEGYFYNGHSDGVGKLTISGKEFYEGEWRLGKMEGKGEYHYPNGDVYKGEFKNGEKSGQGVYFFAAGYQYEGSWSEGVMDGEGLIREGYDQISGVWDNGKKVA